jgi:hypothetical protein
LIATRVVPVVCIQTASLGPCSPRAVVDRYNRSSEVSDGHLRAVARHCTRWRCRRLKAELPVLIDWSGGRVKLPTFPTIGDTDINVSVTE